MKSAKLLLLLACLLIATSTAAAAYAPTNEAALGFNLEEIKINMKEEVASINASEISTILVNLLEREAGYPLMLCMAFYGLALYVVRHDNTDTRRAGRDNSRFT